MTKRITHISSLQNQTLKDALALREARARKIHHTFFVEGVRECQRALSSGFEPLQVFFYRQRLGEAGQLLLDELSARDAGKFELDPKCFNSLVVRKDSGGIGCVFKTKELTLDRIKLGPSPFILAIEGVEKPGNLGALLRSADGAGVDAVVLVEPCVDPYGPNVIRSSLGCVFSVPIVRAKREKFAPFCHANGIKICAAILDEDSVVFSSVNYSAPIAILVGSEDLGLDRFWLDHLSIQVRIPMRGLADSLNVSVAGGILLYEVLRQRMHPK